MAAIRASELYHLYRAVHGDVAALRGLSLTVEQGEVVAVLGPSGSGKSTLLSLCAGLQRPSSGELTVLGQPFVHARPWELARLRRDAIGVVRQHYHRTLPRELRVDEIVAMPLRLRQRFGRAEQKSVNGLIARAGLDKRARAYPSELSGGEQQRVAVCAALAKRPQLVLADEPTGELDGPSTRVVIELLVELANELNATALIVTHDPEVATRSGRTIHIRDGRLAAEGVTTPVLIIDEQGWLRLPRRVREQAGLRERVRANATWGRVELVADEPREHAAAAPARPRLSPLEKRHETEVALDRLGKKYGHDQKVLSEFSWTFAPEQLHVIAGPSGSGKTTLLNLIAGLEQPEEGEIWVGGQRVDSLAPPDGATLRRRVIGYVSQHSTLVEFLTAHENVALALSLRGFSEQEAAARASRWLDWVGLGKLTDRRADRLSGGEQRRIALARALAPKPRVLLADEPTAHLDRITGRLVIRLLKESVAVGTTVIAASHDPDLAASADNTLLLAGGNWRPMQGNSGVGTHAAQRGSPNERSSGS
jgi:ABC-type lipoprotein export system ATPase subunit